MVSALPHSAREALKRGRPLLIVLTGTHGAGKSTFHKHALSHLELPFVNSDHMAEALVELQGGGLEANGAAGVAMAELVRGDLLGRRVSFCVETVLPDQPGMEPAFLALARARNYFVLIIDIRAGDAEVAIARVQQRVQEGGVDAPDSRIVAGFERSRANAAAALLRADAGIVFDNSNPDMPFQLAELWRDGKLLQDPSGAGG